VEDIDQLSIDATLFLLNLSTGKPEPLDFTFVYALCTQAKTFADRIMDAQSLGREVKDSAAAFGEDTAVSGARDLLSGLHDLRTISAVITNINDQADYAFDVKQAIADLRTVSWAPSAEVNEALSQRLKKAFSPADTSLALLTLEGE
jgi:hypothetical protein